MVAVSCDGYVELPGSEAVYLWQLLGAMASMGYCLYAILGAYQRHLVWNREKRAGQEKN